MPMPSSTTANAVPRSSPTASTVASALSLSWSRCRSPGDEQPFRQATALRIFPPTDSVGTQPVDGPASGLCEFPRSPQPGLVPAWHFQARAPWDGTGRRPQGGGVKNRVRSSPGPLAGAHSSVTVKRPPASVGGGPASESPRLRGRSRPRATGTVTNLRARACPSASYIAPRHPRARWRLGLGGRDRRMPPIFCL